MLNVATMPELIQPQINRKTLYNKVLMFLRQSSATKSTAKTIINYVLPVWFSRHTRQPTLHIPCVPSTIKFTFRSVLPYLLSVLGVSEWQVVRYLIDLSRTCATRAATPTPTLISQINQLHPQWSHQWSLEGVNCSGRYAGACNLLPCYGGLLASRASAQ